MKGPLKTVQCALCDRRVKNDWRGKWRHLVNVHPEVVTRRILPLVANPGAAQALGVRLAEIVKGYIR